MRGDVMVLSRALFMAATLLALLSACGGCEANRRSTPSVQQEKKQDTRKEATHARRTIQIAVALWKSNRYEPALQQVIRAAERHDWHRQLRLYPMSEEQFVRLPQEQRDALQQRMLEDLDTLRAIARAMARRAADAQQHADTGQARRWRTALQRLGESNRGAEVPALVDLVGRAIVRQAEMLQP